jgi:23S rRNA (pseudouridine1915-N3)-methyltransferase
MVHFRIISVGKIKEAWIQAGLDHYAKLISKHARIEDTVVKGEKILDESQKAIILEKEAQSIMARLNPGNPLIVLDEHGKNIDSLKFASQLDKYFKSGKSSIDFVIGSPLGLSEHIRQKADLILSLSKMTFPHELARLMLVEQLYRAMSILHGSKYHK